MADSTATPSPPHSRGLAHKLARLGRFIIFLCTAGWLFPHVCTEDMDLTAIQKDQTTKKA